MDVLKLLPDGTKLPAHDPPLEPRDAAVFLLHIAAEVEHALLVQYLYAAYSLVGDEDTLLPGDLPEADLRKLAAGWQQTLLTVAKEEMGHLVTVQNLLRLIGGPITLDREDFPFRSEFYPFHFRLERLTLDSLAKYVAAEMPARPNIDAATKAAIEARAQAADGGMLVNHVGALYARLIMLFSSGPGGLAAADFRPLTAGQQAEPGRTAGHWHGQPIDDTTASNPTGVRVGVVTDRGSALNALRVIAAQGEGLSGDEPNTPAKSHFRRFFEVYDAFSRLSYRDGERVTRRVPTNPNTAGDLPHDSPQWGGRITSPQARGWAHLFNLRYRMLLTLIGVSLREYGPGHDELVARAFAVMRDLTAAAGRLTALPLRDPDDGNRAGPPFELPYTLELPDATADRYRTVLDVIDATGRLIDAHARAFPADAEAVAAFRYPDDFRARIVELAAAAPATPGMPKTPGTPTTPGASVGFARVKQILDDAIAAWKAQHHRDPDLTSGATHDDPGFGWATKQQLLDSAPLGLKLIAPGVAGKDANLVKALRDPDGVEGNGQMPLGGPFLPKDQIDSIIAWIDAGTPD